MKAKKKFLRPGAMNLSGLKKKWRKPRGKHAKIRLSRNGHGLIPKVGYGTGIKEKGLINGLLPVGIVNGKIFIRSKWAFVVVLTWGLLI